MNLNIGSDIDHGARVIQAVDGDIHVSGKVDGSSFVQLTSTNGSITIDGKVDGGSVVKLRAAKTVQIGVVGGSGDKMVNGSSQVQVVAGGDIVLGSKVDGSSSVDFESDTGNVTIVGMVNGSSRATLRAGRDVRIGVGLGLGDMVVDHGSQVYITANGDITLGSKVDGGSTAVLVSSHKTITIVGKVDGSSNVSLIAGGDIRIGLLGANEDSKIDGNSHVDATSGGSISLGYWIHGDKSSVDFKACTGIAIVGEVANGAAVRLMTSTGSISVGGKIGDSNTSVTFFPPGSLAAAGGIQGGAQVHEGRWAAPKVGCTEPTEPITGYWWQNWPQTFGYVSPPRAYPRTLRDLVQAVEAGTPIGSVPIPGQMLKAVGGGWSFTDASLPFRTQAEVDDVSMVIRGASRNQDLQNVLQGIGDARSSPMDLWPETVFDDLAVERRFDQPSLTQRTVSGEVLPGSSKVRLIDTRGLASSLQCELQGMLSDQRPQKPSGADKTFLFHVEAGITMADLAQLLDHQNPRMAIQASGGSPGATLAGTLSTATHGGEFKFPLLVDRVRAVHLVGPGGEEWWIEGDEPIADPVKLHARYPRLDTAHFIGGGWNAIPGLRPQNVLDAVIVSMGTMGVIYSIVLEVVPQFGLQQIVTPLSWTDLLGKAGVTEDQLRNGHVHANKAVLDVILNGKVNGTGIPRADNVYADLAINPITRDCWITNRLVTRHLPIDSNSPAPTINDYMAAISTAMCSHAVDNVGGSLTLGRIFDFLNYGTDPVNLVLNDVGNLSNFVRFLTRFPDLLSAAAGTISAQTVANVANEPSNSDRGLEFVGDLLTGFLHALQGTALGTNSNRTDISYKVGAIGWPAGGLPGRGLEVAMDETRVFSFLQTVLFDDVLTNTMVGQNKPLLGYISIRVCRPTRTLMGMQQYSPFSVMTEVVAYRSPEADVIMDAIQEKVLELNRTERLQALLHWGLENQLLRAADLLLTPLADAIGAPSTFSRLEGFRTVRKFLKKGHPPVFDNNFVERLHL